MSWKQLVAGALSVTGLTWLAGAARPTAAARADEPTRQTMDEIFEAIRFALPLSFDDARFADPRQRTAILEALTALAERGRRLEAHGRSEDAGFGFLSRTLARDASDVRERYADGRHAEARFLLHQMIDACVACHSRLPTERETRLGERLTRDPRVAELPLEERAKLQMATRQFDQALASHEALFASPDASPASLDLMGHFDDYLEICIRVREDFERPLEALERFSERGDLSRSLRANLNDWTASLRELREREPLADPMDEARALLETAEDRGRFSDDRAALVYYVAASGVLHRHVASHPEPDAKLSEAYYLLGLVETRVGRSFWLSQSESLLETAIRLAPGDPVAEKAYALLEEFTAFGYTGSAGGDVPPDIRRRLDALRLLIDPS